MAKSNKTLTWLDEVRSDADFNARRRVREAEEQAAYDEQKAKINQVVTEENEEVREELVKNPSPLSTGKPELTDDVKELDEVKTPKDPSGKKASK